MLEALCDFPDDALQATITPRHVDAMMATLRAMGVSRVSWGYYGDGHGGLCIPAHLDEQWSRYAATLRQLGNPLQVAAEAAHRHGLELYAYYKPYETGPGIAVPDGCPEAREFGRLKQQGGWLLWLDPFVIENPHLRLRHRDAGERDLSGIPVCALQLSKKDDSPTRVTREHLQIWSSARNGGYRRLDMDFSVQETVEPAARDVRDLNGSLLTRKGDPVRTLTLSGFALTDPYLLVTTDFSGGPADFENAGTALLTALDAEGCEIPGVFATGTAVWLRDRIDFRRWGVLFDVAFRPACMRLDEPNESGRQGFIAFARGRNEYLPGALCETEPRVREFWLSCLREMVEAGVDGVDFRVENHGTHTDYPDEYGFNAVVLEECARRGNTDPATIAQVRGEAYTGFLREARRLLSAHGKRMRINLNVDYFRPDPPPHRQLAYPAHIHCDWSRWVEERLLDEAIVRIFALPFATIFDDPVAQEMIDRCRERAIPLTVNRYIGPDNLEEFRRVQQDGRFAGWILYETATYLRFDDTGGCSLQHDVVADICREMKAGAGIG